MNLGKAFEEDFFESFFQYVDKGLKNKVREPKYPHISIDRVNDNTGGYAGVAGYCDFNVFRYPNLFHFELKSVPDRRIDFSLLTPKQFSGLSEKSKVPGICAGLVVEFQENGRFAHSVFFIDIRDFCKIQQESVDRKSIPFEQILDIGIPLFGEKKRTRYTYMVFSWLDTISRKCRR